jgi:hypothetical protein
MESSMMMKGGDSKPLSKYIPKVLGNVQEKANKWKAR